ARRTGRGGAGGGLPGRCAAAAQKPGRRLSGLSRLLRALLEEAGGAAVRSRGGGSARAGVRRRTAEVRTRDGRGPLRRSRGPAGRSPAAVLAGAAPPGRPRGRGQRSSGPSCGGAPAMLERGRERDRRPAPLPSRRTGRRRAGGRPRRTGAGEGRLPVRGKGSAGPSGQSPRARPESIPGSGRSCSTVIRRVARVTAT